MIRSPDREQLKRLLDLVPEEDLPAVERLLLGLIALDRDPLGAPRSGVATVAAPVAPPPSAPRPAAAAPPVPPGDPLSAQSAEIEQARRRLLDMLEDD